MIRTELYFDFRNISREDFLGQIEFYEKYIDVFESDNVFDSIKSRQDFIRLAYILHSCGVAYSRTNNNETAISIFDRLIDEIRNQQSRLNFDLNKEHYYIDSLFEKGKVHYNLKKYPDAEKSFKVIMDTGFANSLHANWYSYSRNARLFNNLNYWILAIVIILMIVPDIAFSLTPEESLRISILNFVLILIYFTNPSKRLSAYLTRKNAERFNKNLKSRVNPIEYYTEKINGNPEDYVSLVERGISYNLADEYEKSLEDLNAALEINSNNSDALYYRAIAFSKFERYQEALEDINASIQIGESDKAELFHNRGYTHMMLKDFKSALDDYNKAIELDPYQAHYRFNRAFLFQDNGKNQEAIEDYNMVIKLEPENYIAMTNRGEAHYAIGNKEMALSDLNRAKEFDYAEAIELLEKLNFE